MSLSFSCGPAGYPLRPSARRHEASGDSLIEFPLGAGCVAASPRCCGRPGTCPYPYLHRAATPAGAVRYRNRVRRPRRGRSRAHRRPAFHPRAAS
ncbi:MAG: hypothetical protein WKG07_07650 [Hymenobacter sp.]